MVKMSNGAPQFDFETFIANLIPGVVFDPFEAIFFPAEGFFEWVRNVYDVSNSKRPIEIFAVTYI